MAYQVTSAYATLRIPDDRGQEVLIGFYQDAILPANVNREDLERHVRKGMVVKVDLLVPEASEPVVAEEEPKGPEKTNGKPAGNASRDDWAAYAASKGAPEEDTKPVDQGGLSRDDLRAKYGS